MLPLRGGGDSCALALFESRGNFLSRLQLTMQQYEPTTAIAPYVVYWTLSLPYPSVGLVRVRLPIYYMTSPTVQPNHKPGTNSPSPSPQYGVLKCIAATDACSCAEEPSCAWVRDSSQ